MTVQEWLDRQRCVPDADPDDGLEAATFSRAEDPALFDEVERYLDLRDEFADVAKEVANLMYERGWEPI